MDAPAYRPLIPEAIDADNGTGNKRMTQKSGFAAVDNDRRLIKENALAIREALFSCITDTQVECAVGFARYLSRAGLNAENYWLFLRLVVTNNPWVIDELLHDREPRLLFSTIQPSAELVEASFQALFSRHPEEIYPKALEALLGVVENAYFDPDDGFRLRRISIMDINTLGKFLLKDEPQEHAQNRLVLEILDRLTHLGEYYGEPDKNVLAKHAFNVRFAYFDRTRDLVDAIPHPLLVRMPDRNAAEPEEDFAELVAKRRLRIRDERGRFVREPAVPSPSEASAAKPKPANPSPAKPRQRKPKA
ncbi:MAG TPA: hypothetical protein PKW82_10090 [Spirochaetales bacterium]|nr:hypothetical protein [Spirochaetales bacterium]